MFHCGVECLVIFSCSCHRQADDIAQLILNILQTPIHVQIHDILVRPTEQQI